MWLATQHGFYSIVRKQGESRLTVRARVAEDLDVLRKHFLPELSPTVTGAGTDYPFRGTCSAAAFAAAQVKLALDIDYANFKQRVGQVQGAGRSGVYGQAWAVFKKLEGQGPAAALHGSGRGKKDSYGGVLLDEEGRVLLRRPKGDFDGARWTFAKGRPNVGESPEQAALREVLEETGYTAEILAPIPGAFEGTTTSNRYWLMRAVEKIQEPHWETQSVCWCTPDEARAHIEQSPSRTKRKRDLAVLSAGLKTATSL
jgi:8-oxo-dGTP diphosphatase